MTTVSWGEETIPSSHILKAQKSCFENLSFISCADCRAGVFWLSVTRYAVSIRKRAILCCSADGRLESKNLISVMMILSYFLPLALNILH